MERTTKLNQIRRDKAEILSLKKGAVKYTDATTLGHVEKVDEANKKMFERNLPLDTDDAVYRTLIANTYNYMDSHGDVHLNGIFKKSLEETKKIFLLHDHKFEVTAQIGSILKAYEQDGRFLYYGFNSPLDTQALLLDVEIDKSKNELVYNGYKKDEINQHSVGMYYVKIDLAMDDKADPQAYALYQRLLPSIGNADEVAQQGYFFAVSEAKLKEVSAVLAGSNPLTGVFDNNKGAISIDQVQKMFDYLSKNVENKEIFNNICKQYTDTLKHIEPPKGTQTATKPLVYNYIY
jgi:hypothetical protein